MWFLWLSLASDPATPMTMSLAPTPGPGSSFVPVLVRNLPMTVMFDGASTVIVAFRPVLTAAKQ